MFNIPARTYNLFNGFQLVCQICLFELATRVLKNSILLAFTHIEGFPASGIDQSINVVANAL
jgi:hypothetical protein